MKAKTFTPYPQDGTPPSCPSKDTASPAGAATVISGIPSEVTTSLTKKSRATPSVFGGTTIRSCAPPSVTSMRVTHRSRSPTAPSVGTALTSL